MKDLVDEMKEASEKFRRGQRIGEEELCDVLEEELSVVEVPLPLPVRRVVWLCRTTCG